MGVDEMRERRRVLTIDSYLWPNRYMLAMHGLWPADPGETKSSSRLSVRLCFCFSVFAITSVFVPEVLLIIVSWGDIAILTGVGCVTTTVGLLLFKMAYALVRQSSFNRAYLITRELWSAIVDGDDEAQLGRRDMEMLAGWAKRLSIIFLLSGLSINVSFTTAAVIPWIMYEPVDNESRLERNMPFDVWLESCDRCVNRMMHFKYYSFYLVTAYSLEHYSCARRYGFDIQPTPIFEIAFSWQSVAAIYCCTGTMGFDSTMMTLVLHVCAQFRIISARFRDIGRRMQENEDYSTPDQVAAFRREFGRVVQQHCFMLRFAEEVRQLLSPIIFVQLLTSGLEICLSGYAVIVGGTSHADVFKFTCYLSLLIVQLIIWCWPGQLLIQDSQMLGDVVCYELPWHLLLAPEQRDLGFLIMRTQKECQITALGFQVMSLAKLTEIFNAAGSYLALLRKSYEKQMMDQ